MRPPLRAALLLLLLAGPARAWRLWGEPSDKKIRPVQALADERKDAEVVAALTPDFMQTLRGTDLRQAYVLKGDSLAVLGRVDEALGVYQLGVRLFPKNVDLLTRQGDVLHRIGLDEQARIFYLRALNARWPAFLVWMFGPAVFVGAKTENMIAGILTLVCTIGWLVLLLIGVVIVLSATMGSSGIYGALSL